MIRPVILAVGHGSRVAAAVSEARAFVAALAADIGQDVVACFLELADPDMATGLTQAAEQAGAGGSVVVLPLFLGAAGHQKNDVAVAIGWVREQFPRVNFRLAAPLAPHAKLVELLALRVGEALAQAGPGAEQTGVLVVGRGSSDPAGNAEVARLAYLLFAGGRFHAVEYAFQAVARPKMAEGVRRCHALGARQVVVAPYLLFTGDVEQDIRQVTEEAARSLDLSLIHADHLGVHPLLIDIARQRLDDAQADAAAMTCDLCKYRFALPGFERQVGLPQTTHHLHGGAHPDHEHSHHDGSGHERSHHNEHDHAH